MTEYDMAMAVIGNRIETVFWVIAWTVFIGIPIVVVIVYTIYGAVNKVFKTIIKAIVNSR